MSRHILYLCGPMSDLPHNNYPAFNEAARQLRAAGYMVINPAETTLPHDAPWVSHMRKDIADLVNTCDAVATLPGWQQSRGAQIEVGIAIGLGWPVQPLDGWVSLGKELAATESLLEP